MFRAFACRDGFMDVGTRGELGYKRRGDDAQGESHGGYRRALESPVKSYLPF